MYKNYIDKESRLEKLNKNSAEYPCIEERIKYFVNQLPPPQIDKDLWELLHKDSNNVDSGTEKSDKNILKGKEVADMLRKLCEQSYCDAMGSRWYFPRIIRMFWGELENPDNAINSMVCNPPIHFYRHLTHVLKTY